MLDPRARLHEPQPPDNDTIALPAPVNPTDSEYPAFIPIPAYTFLNGSPIIYCA